MQSNIIYDENWVFKIFSIEVWEAILFILLILNTVEFISKISFCKEQKVKEKIGFFVIQDYFFNTLGILTNQGNHHNLYKL